jgi:uncharacterized protein (DUF2235 family)
MNGRNLVLCFDGTNNQFGPEDTNVVRLVRVLDRNPAAQRLYYDPGVGTLPEPGLLLPVAKTFSDWLGLGFGLGLSRKISQAYEYLMNTWEPGNRVFLVGFSRGAYTARVLAGMLHAIGLLPRGGSNLVPYALRYFRKVTEGHHRDSTSVDNSKWKQLCADFRYTFSRPVSPDDKQRHFPVHFLGVWDTVSSVGWVWDPKHFPYTAWNPSVAHMRHAVSIDERRAFFRQNLFSSTGNRDAVELWFPGVHSDVGGGYAKDRGRIWWNPFSWILDEARQFGLSIDQDRLNEVLANPPARPWAEPINNSLTPAWYIGEIWPKLTWYKNRRFRLPRLNLASRRFIHQGALIEQTALERIRDGSLNYIPKNLSPDFRTSIKALSQVPRYLAVQ